MRSRSIVVCMVVGLCLSASVQAAAIVDEPFDYASGSIHGQSGGQGFAAPWDCTWTGGEPAETVPCDVELGDGLTFAGYETSGKASWSSFLTNAHPGYGASVDATRALSSAISTRPGPGAENSVWVGALYQHSGSQVRNSWQGMSLVQTGSAYYYGVTIGLNKLSISTGQFGIGVGASNSLFPAPDRIGHVDWTYDNETQANGGDRGKTYFLLAKLVFAGDDGTVDAYLNVYEDGQALPTSDPVSWDAHAWRDAVPQNWDSQLEQLVQLGTPYSTSLTGDLLDEVRIGSTMQDVLLVPEPASLCLLAVAGLWSARRRR